MFKFQSLNSTFSKLLFVLFLSVTALLFALTLKIQNTLKKEANQSNIESINKAKNIILTNLNAYTYGLQGTNGVYIAANYFPSKKLFRNYAESRDLFNNFSGSNGFGFIRYVPQSTRNEFFSRYKKDGIEIKTISKQYSAQFADHMIIERIEPIEKNAPALGLDIGSESNRRKAAIKSAISGNLSVTEPIQLVQSKKKEAGFLIFLPLYKSQKVKNLSTLIGWAYSPLRLEVIAEEIKNVLDDRIDISVIYKNSKNEETLILDTKDKNRPSSKSSQIVDQFNYAGLTFELIGKPVKTLNETFTAIFLWATFAFITILNFLIILWIRKLYLLNKQNIEKVDSIEKWSDAVVNASSYSIISTDLNGKIISFNKSAEKMLGYSAAEMVNKQSPQIIHLESEIIERANVLSNELNLHIQPGFEVFVAKAKIQEFDINEWTYVRKDGSKFTVRLCVTALKNSKNEIFGFLGIGEDVTENKKIFEQLEQQRSQLVQAAKMSTLGEMAGGIAHEINNPLNAIQNNIDFIQIKIELDDTIEKEWLTQHLKKINQIIFRISKIVTGLRTFSRSDESEPYVNVPVQKIIDDTLELCSAKLKFKNVNLSVDIPTNKNILCNPTQITQVLLNLISNSYDAIQNSDTKWINISAYQETSSKYIITVTDSGNGIHPDISDKIMQPFFTTKSSSHGTGIGLSISLGIMKKHNGDLFLDKNNKNTSFKMFFTQFSDI